MKTAGDILVGTSGYSFSDWVGTFYPTGTKKNEMLSHYARHFRTVELNFTYYAMPSARTLETMARLTPSDFIFWIKANQETTHNQNRSIVGEYIENVMPLRDAGKMGGVLMQFPQSFHRTVANRKYLSQAIEDFRPLPLAVEFRHCSWEHSSVASGLRERDVTLVVPDAPQIDFLYHCTETATNRTGYVRLHSRNAANWYLGAVARYDYDYSNAELTEIARQWSQLDEPVDRIYAFFNNCHQGQAADNAESFKRILAELVLNA